MSKIKRIVNHYCQKCKKIIEQKVVNLEIRDRKLCEDCAYQMEEDEEYRNLPPCQICHRPVRDEYAMTTKNGSFIHEECYEGGDD